MTGGEELFSHPDTQKTHAANGQRNDEQKSYTDLFREPPSAPENHQQNG